MQVDYYGELSHGIVTIVKVFQPIIFKVLASEQLIQFTSQRLFQIYQKQNRHLREEKCKPYEKRQSQDWHELELDWTIVFHGFALSGT